MARVRAMTVEPGRPGSATVDEVPDPGDEVGGLAVRGLLVGVCGTDREIAEGAYGEPPSGHAKLIIGHEGLGEVLDAPADSGFQPGDPGRRNRAAPRSGAVPGLRRRGVGHVPQRPIQ